MDIPGATQASYSIVVTTMADHGAVYRNLVTNADGTVTSNPAILTITPSVLIGTRVTKDLQALYNFTTGLGKTVADRSGVGSPLNLTTNGDVSWTASGLSVNTIGSISSGGPATKLNEAIKLSNTFTVEAWITPANLIQDTRSPVTIVALQTTGITRNVFLGQGAAAYMSNTVTSGTGGDGFFLRTVAGIATVAATHVVLTRDANLGKLRLYVNGVESASDFSPGDLSNWDISRPLVLGSNINNLFTTHWVGEYHLVALYSRGITAAEVNQNYTSGPSGTDPAVIAVEPPATQNIAPVAIANIASFDTPVVASSYVYMGGTDSTDSDGIIVSYAWIQTAGTAVSLTGANTAYPYFYAPVVTASTVLTFQLTVTDDLGATGTALVSITVTP